MTNNDTPELLPCPFCGGEAEIEEISEENSHTGTAGYAAGCANSECLVYQTFDKFALRKDAVKAWNTRAPSPDKIVIDRGDVPEHLMMQAKLMLIGDENSTKNIYNFIALIAVQESGG